MASEIITQGTEEPLSRRRRFFAACAIAVVLVFGASAGLVMATQMRLQRQTGQLAGALARGPRVLVEPIHQSQSAHDYEIPVTIRGYVETSVYAKVAGYLKTIYVDKGDRVKKGQVIAILESPELDKQVADAKAAYWYQEVTDRRNQYLLNEGVIAQQMADDTHALMLQTKAAYEQMVAIQSYEIVRSLFDGVVTARFFDQGALIPQSTSPSTFTSNTPIISMATLRPLRIYANVPQTLAPLIHDGDQASVTVTEYPQASFNGTVTRHPDALDEASRTMLVEVDLPNLDLKLLPGMYGSVHLKTAAPAGALVAPDDALVFRDGKVFLPIVRGSKLHLAQVSLGHDNGLDVVVNGDIHDGDLVALSVGQAVHDGEPVQPVTQSSNSI
jgi:membrane fusion protein, multidrug efflux system